MNHTNIILGPRHNGRHFPDDIFKCIFLIKIYKFWLRFHWNLFPKVQLLIFHWNLFPKDQIVNIPALVQMMALHRQGYKPLSEPMMVNLLTHICVTRPQWEYTVCFCDTQNETEQNRLLCVFKMFFARVINKNALACWSLSISCEAAWSLIQPL